MKRRRLLSCVPSLALLLLVCGCSGSTNGESSSDTGTADGASVHLPDGATTDTETPAACESTTWSKRIPGGEQAAAVGVATADDCGVLVVADQYPGPLGETDIRILRLDETGAITNDAMAGGPDEDSAAGVVRRPDGSFVVAGTTRADGNDDFLLVFVSADGEVTDRKSWGGESIDQLMAIANAPDGGLLLAGSTTGDSAGDFDGIVLRLEADGTERWRRVLAGHERDEWDRLAAVAPTADDGAVAAGYLAEPGNRRYTSWLVRLDDQGEPDWNVELGWGRAFGVAEASNGDVLVAGHRYAVDCCSTPPWAARVDRDGDVRWSEPIGTLDGGARTLALRPDDGLWLAGYSLEEPTWAHDPLPGPYAPRFFAVDGDGAVTATHDLASPPDRWEVVNAMAVLPGDHPVLVGTSQVADTSRTEILVVRPAVPRP